MLKVENQKIIQELIDRADEALELGVNPQHDRFDKEILGFTQMVLFKQFWGVLKFLSSSRLSDEKVSSIASTMAEAMSGDEIKDLKVLTKKMIRTSPPGAEEVGSIEGWIDSGIFSDAFLENPQDGSGIDLVMLEIYAYLGFLNYYYFGWNPEILSDILREHVKENNIDEDVYWNHRRNRDDKMPLSIDPIKYIKTLIEKCEGFIYSVTPHHEEFTKQHKYFVDTIRYAKARLALDTEEYIKAEEVTFLTGLGLPTLANKKNLLKNSSDGFVIETQTALDLIALEGGRDRRDAHPLLKKKFYKSIWQDQVRLGIAPALKELSEGTFITIDEMLIFKMYDSKNIASQKIIPKNPYEDKKFVKICEKFHPNVAPHNKARVEWIGLGKTFNEINAPNSKYRECVVRQTYAGNSSEIIEDLKYDLKKGWIKEV
jgi:hypothetical protein